MNDIYAFSPQYYKYFLPDTLYWFNDEAPALYNLNHEAVQQCRLLIVLAQSKEDTTVAQTEMLKKMGAALKIEAHDTAILYKTDAQSISFYTLQQQSKFQCLVSMGAAPQQFNIAAELIPYHFYAIANSGIIITDALPALQKALLWEALKKSFEV